MGSGPVELYAKKMSFTLIRTTTLQGRKSTIIIDTEPFVDWGYSLMKSTR